MNGMHRIAYAPAPPPRSLLPPGRPSGILWPMKRHLPVIGLLVLAVLALLVAGCGPI